MGARREAGKIVGESRRLGDSPMAGSVWRALEGTAFVSNGEPL